MVVAVLRHKPGIQVTEAAFLKSKKAAAGERAECLGSAPRGAVLRSPAALLQDAAKAAVASASLTTNQNDG